MFFLVILHRWIFNWQISFLYFNFIGLMQCSKILSVISSTDWERIIRAMKLHQYFEFGPASQDPFSFCQIKLALDTVWVHYSIQGHSGIRKHIASRTESGQISGKKQVKMKRKSSRIVRLSSTVFEACAQYMAKDTDVIVHRKASSG